MSAPLIDSIGRAFELSDYVVGVHWLGEAALFLCGDATAQAFSGAGEPLWKKADIHDGALLASCRGYAGDVITCGEDGAVVSVDATGATALLAKFPGSWIEALDAHPSVKLAAVAVGKEAVMIGPNGVLHRFAHDHTVQGVAFEPSGRRIAAAHYDGATVSWAASPDSRRKHLAWKGAHLSASWSRDGKFVVTTMQENALHGWRLQDGQHFRMAGYPAKIRSVSWSADGKHLATAGADEVVVWPFVGANGPMGQSASVAGSLGTPCAVVACHPTRMVVAAGGSDGEIALMPLGGGKPLLIDPAHGARVTALAWSQDGRRLAFGTESARAGVLDFTGALET